jgi:hypothetical protein
MKQFLTAAALVVSASSVNATTIDFDSNFGAATKHGDVFAAFDFGGGITGSVSVFNRRSNSVGEARIFDTTLSGTSDDDLEGPFENALLSGDIRTFGKSLIIQERAGVADSNADDEAKGGTITFNFDSKVRLDGLVYLDGERGVSISTGSTFLGGFGNGGSGDHLFRIIDFTGTVAANGITSIEVDFIGSGAIGALQVAAVPLPAGLPLMLAALGGLALVRRQAPRRA